MIGIRHDGTGLSSKVDGQRNGSYIRRLLPNLLVSDVMCRDGSVLLHPTINSTNTFITVIASFANQSQSTRVHTSRYEITTTRLVVDKQREREAARIVMV
jgi:hypothetical protein